MIEWRVFMLNGKPLWRRSRAIVQYGIYILKSIDRRIILYRTSHPTDRQQNFAYTPTVFQKLAYPIRKLDPSHNHNTEIETFMAPVGPQVGASKRWIIMEAPALPNTWVLRHCRYYTSYMMLIDKFLSATTPHLGSRSRLARWVYASTKRRPTRPGWCGKRRVGGSRSRAGGSRSRIGRTQRCLRAEAGKSLDSERTIKRTKEQSDQERTTLKLVDVQKIHQLRHMLDENINPPSESNSTQVPILYRYYSRVPTIYISDASLKSGVRVYQSHRPISPLSRLVYNKYHDVTCMIDRGKSAGGETFKVVGILYY